jgi:hypothetical protein
MKKFDAGTVRKIDHLNGELVDAHAALSDAIDTYNRAVAEAFAEFNKEVELYNDTIESVLAECETISDSLVEYYDSKTDAWLESKAGIDFANWKDEWCNVELESFEAVEPDEVLEPELPSLDASLKIK